MTTRFMKPARADWACRRAELSARVQHDELGDKPRPLPVEARMDGQDPVVGVTKDGKTLSFPARITLPAVGKPSSPAIIGIGMVTLDNADLQRMGIALATFPNERIGEQAGGQSRGKVAFYDGYGKDQTAGSMTAGSWGVRRLVDALEKTPASGIDARRLVVTGCARNGKGAIVAGALGQRIVLAIAQESGAGGAACWCSRTARWNGSAPRAPGTTRWPRARLGGRSAGRWACPRSAATLTASCRLPSTAW